MRTELIKSQVNEIRKLHTEIADMLKSSLVKAIRIGELLTEQKTSLKHGEFIPWINKNLSFGDRQARKYMTVYKEKDLLKRNLNSDLTAALAEITYQKEKARREKRETFNKNKPKLIISIEENSYIAKLDKCAGILREKPPKQWSEAGFKMARAKADILIKRFEAKDGVGSRDIPDRIKEVAKEIKAGNISDDDAKVVGDALADAISEGKAAPRVATKAATAVKTVMSKNKKPPQYKGNFERLSNHCMSFAEGLQFWADGTIVPETDDEGIWAATILSAAPSIVMHYDRLGLNIEEMLNIAQGKEITDVIQGGEVETGVETDAKATLGKNLSPRYGANNPRRTPVELYTNLNRSLNMVSSLYGMRAHCYHHRYRTYTCFQYKIYHIFLHKFYWEKKHGNLYHGGRW